MRILIAIQGSYGKRMVDNIRKNAPVDWQVNELVFPADLPAIIDDPDAFMARDLPKADLLISLGEHPGIAQMIPDMAERTGAAEAVRDYPPWMTFWSSG